MRHGSLEIMKHAILSAKLENQVSKKNLCNSKPVVIGSNPIVDLNT